MYMYTYIYIYIYMYVYIYIYIYIYMYIFRRFLSTYGLAFRCLALIFGAFLVFGVLAMVGFRHLFRTCF